MAMTRWAWVGALLLLVSGTALAENYNAPWWLHYRVQGGSRVYERGPYRDRYKCEGDRYRLPYGAEFLGCVQ